MATVTLGKALNEGLRKAMEADPKVVIMGEDVGRLGGVFRITDELQKDFGEDRVIDTPLAESGIVGTAIGMSIRGFRPVCEIQFDGFVFPGFDQIVSQVAKMHYRSAGTVKMPITIRIPYGGGIGAVEHHSESPEALLRAHRRPEGRRVLEPARRLHDDPAGGRRRRPDRVLRAEAALLGQGRPRLGQHRPGAAAATARGASGGSAATLITYGPSVRTCLEAAAAAAERRPRARGRRPAGALADRLADGHRLGHQDRRRSSCHEAPVFGSLAGEIAARVSEQCFYSLEAPVLRVAVSTPVPAAPRRRGLPSRSRPDPRRGRPLARVLRGRRCRRTRTSGCPTSVRG